MINPFPNYNTPFVGRDGDVKKVTSLLSSEDCRLLTIIGPGGIGKTRVAIEVANQCADQYDNVVFVHLKPITTSEQIPFALAESIGCVIRNHDTPLTELSNVLNHQSWLIVIDTLEHLTHAIDFLSDILGNTKQVNFLGTSREVLNLVEEWTYPIVGLSIPSNNDPHPEKNDAAQLFSYHAQRIQPHFDIEMSIEPIIAICQLVNGMPLALEIAASWVRTLSCQEIADEIQKNTNFLTTSQRNMPEHHRSLRSVFDWSWALLTPNEQTIFAKLSVFHAGFDRSAAESIVGASLHQLTSLVEKSLLYYDNEGRYSFHDLLHQFATEKLTGTTHSSDTYKAHAQYYARFMADRTQALFSGQQAQMVQEIQLEQHNVLAALNWFLGQGYSTEVEQILLPLDVFFQISNRFAEALNIYERALVYIEKYQEDKGIQFLANTLVTLAWFYIRAGETEKAYENATRSQALYDKHQFPVPLTNGHTADPALVFSMVYLIQGNYPTAQNLALQALDNIGDALIPYGNLHTAYYLLSSIHSALGEYEQALEYVQFARRTAERDGDGWFLAYCYIELGNITRNMGDYETAKIHYETSYSLRQKFNDIESEALTLNLLGEVSSLLRASHNLTRRKKSRASMSQIRSSELVSQPSD